MRIERFNEIKEPAMMEAIGLLAQHVDNPLRDGLVALVALVLGLNILFCAATGNARCYDVGSVRMIEQRFGRTGAAIFLVFVGGLCIALGSYLAAKSVMGRAKLAQVAIFNNSAGAINS